MKNICIVLLTIFIFTACLKAKKSPFDISTPTTGLIFGFAASFGSQTATTTGTTAGTGTGTGTVNNTFSVGGTITGFTTGTLVLQNNNTNDLTLSSAGNYSFSGLASGATYSISVKSHPTGLACTITNATGTLTANVTNANIACTTSTVNALYSLGNTAQSYWLDYVKSDGTSPLNATGTACTGTETGFYNACIHAGEFKKVTIPNITSCDGITATDSLSAFNWRCVVATDSSVSVISTGLRGDKGLSDLIDFTSPGSFRNNSVTVLSNGNSLLTSATGKWWDNPIVVANDGGSLGTTKTIYIVNTNVPASDYRMNSVDKIALVVKPGITKDLSNATGNLILMTNKFQWVEGSFYNNAMITNIVSIASTARFAVLRNLNLLGNTTFTVGIMATSASNIASYLHNIRLSSLDVGLHMNSNGAIINQVIANNCQSCIRIYQSDMIVLNSLAFNGGTTSAAYDSSSNGYNSNLYLNNTSANHNLGGISLSTGGGTINKTTYYNTLSANNGSGVINNNALSTKYINLITADNNATFQFTETGTTSNSIMNGILKVSGVFCTIGAVSGVGATCNKLNGSETTPATVNSITLANSFVGKVTSTDTKNTSNTNGFSVAAPTDWFNFSNMFRGFGNDGGAFPVSANRSNCTNNCRIWDWSLKSTDTVARNVNPCPNGTIVDTHQWSDTTAPNQAYCDANYKGSAISGTTCITTFLRNAVEIFGDGVGNENGICESNEECLYTPNIGAYQGHSSDSTNTVKLIPASQTSATTTTCADVTTGTVSNVKLWKYDTNGY